MNKETIFIDQNIYQAISGKKSRKSYETFLENNPNFVDLNYSSKKEIKEDVIAKEKIQKELEQNLEKTEDYRYVMNLIWLEMYLPKYERKYGAFKYSNENMTNREKCEELLEYYADVCGIGDIKKIPLNAKNIKGKLN